MQHRFKPHIDCYGHTLIFTLPSWFVTAADDARAIALMSSTDYHLLFHYRNWKGCVDEDDPAMSDEFIGRACVNRPSADPDFIGKYYLCDREGYIKWDLAKSVIKVLIHTGFFRPPDDPEFSSGVVPPEATCGGGSTAQQQEA